MIIAITSAISVALAVFFMLRFNKVGKLDLPTDRSLHKQPIPRSGGLAMLFAFSAAFIASDWPLSLALSVALITTISWLDDQFAVPAVVRLVVHFIAAILALSAIGLATLEPVLQLVLVVAIVWSSNLYNFMDGADGLAGGMAFFGFLVMALAATAAGADDVAIFCLCISAGAFGFLLFNFQPARIFLGDIGSVTLGFVCSIVSVIGMARGIWPWWFPLLAFSPFIIDSSVTLLIRLCQGKNVLRAHNDHYYQRLVRMGWSHRRLAVVEYLLMITLSVLALAALRLGETERLVLISFAAVAYIIFARLIDRRWGEFVQMAVGRQQS